MSHPLHKNFIKSSNLIFLSLALGLISALITLDQFITRQQIVIAVLTMLFILGLGILVRQGYPWIKYLLLIIFGVGLLSIPVTVMLLGQNPLVGVINVIQTVLQFWAMFILFKVPKTVVQNPVIPGAE